MAPQHRRRPSSASTATTINATTSTTTAASVPKHQNHHHQRTSTAPTTPTLLRIPTSSSTLTSAPRRRRATNPSTPTTLAPAPVDHNTTTAASAVTPTSTSHATSPSYFSPQPSASSSEARSPANRRPPASFSGHGIDTSRGPPIALITRGSYSADIARHAQKLGDFAHAQHQLLQSGLLSPDTAKSTHPSPSVRSRRNSTANPADSTPPVQTPNLSRQNSAQSQTNRREPMASSIDDSSEYDSGVRSQTSETPARFRNHAPVPSPGADGEQGEDLFLNIAQDSPGKDASVDVNGRVRSRTIKRPSEYRRSLPTSSYLPTSADSTPATSRHVPSSIDTKNSQNRRTSGYLASPSVLSRAQREQSPLSPAGVLETPRSRNFGVSPQTSFSSSRARDQDVSPHFIPQIERRRPSFPDAIQTPPSRTQGYRPSNLQYTSSHVNDETPHIDTPDQANSTAYSRGDGTESLDSTGAPASVWDELDDLKSRIRKIELLGKMPATAAAAVSNGSGERPRTATTSNTTVSTSPQHVRKQSDSPAEPAVFPSSKTHPLLQSALSKAKEHVPTHVYRYLEASAADALQLAEMTGSAAGPQGTLFSASSIISGGTVPDRNIRRKADSLCRSLTELCIALTDLKPDVKSAPTRSATVIGSRRASVQVNGDSPHIRASVEPEGGIVPRTSPARAMTRIESRARRSSIINLNGSYNASPREVGAETHGESQSNHMNRAGTTLRQRRGTVEDEDDDPTIRAPSRAFTDFRPTQTSRLHRVSRDYSSREPMPGLQPSPSLQASISLQRHPTVSGATRAPRDLLFRDSSRRTIERQGTPKLDAEVSPRAQPPLTQYSANSRSIGGTSTLRSFDSAHRRLRGSSVGE